MTLDKKHGAELRSWVLGADAGTDFRVLNLPPGVFSRRSDRRRRTGVAIGDTVPAVMEARLLCDDGNVLLEPTLQDGDTVIMIARCEHPDFTSIGLGSCDGTIVAAAA